MINDILNDSSKLIFVIMAFVVFVDLVMAFVFFNLTKQFVVNARMVKAKITKLEPYSKGIKASLLLKDPLGKEVETSIMVSLMKRYKENDEIEILSGKENPQKVKFNSFFSLWIIPLGAFQGAVMMSVVLGILVHMGTAKLPF
jgi:hypothetical protein